MSPLDPEIPPTGEEIHLPGPSIQPFLVAVGVAMFIVGLTWKTWLLTPNDQFRPAPPPAYDSEQMARDLEAIKSFPRTNATNVTRRYALGDTENPCIRTHICVPVHGICQSEARWCARARGK